MDDDASDALPALGRHRGGTPDEDTGQTVRAPTGPEGGDARPTAPTYQVLEHEDGTSCRVRKWPAGVEVRTKRSSPYDEVDRFDAVEDAKQAVIARMERPFYLVLENTRRGTVRYDPEQRLLDHWLEQPTYDRVTVFGDAAAADEYARKQEG